MSWLLQLIGAGDTAAGREELQVARYERIRAQNEHDRERSVSTRSVAIANRAHRMVMSDVDRALQELRNPDSLSRFKN